MKLHSIILVVLLIPGIVSASDDSYDTALAFERGLSVGVDAVEREYRIQGWKEEAVEPLDYMVVLDSKSCSTKKVLLLKDFGFRRGLSPIELTNNTLYYKSFDSRPDADELVRYLNDSELKEIPEKVYVYKKRSNEKFRKAPFAFKYIFDRMQKEIKDGVQVLVMTPERAKSLGVVVKAEPIAVEAAIMEKPVSPSPVVISAPMVIAGITDPVEQTKAVPAAKTWHPTAKVVKAPVPQVKKTVIKAPRVKPAAPAHPFSLTGGSVEYFSYMDKSGASDGLRGKTFDDKKFKVQKVLPNKGQVFSSAGSIVSINGVRYVKVAGKNMYFDAYSTTLGEE